MTKVRESKRVEAMAWERYARRRAGGSTVASSCSRASDAEQNQVAPVVSFQSHAYLQSRALQGWPKCVDSCAMIGRV